MSSLSIELENHPVVNHLKGYLLLQNDSLLPDSICHLQLVGTQSEPILLEPPYLRFDIPLPLLSEDMEYSLRASVRGSKNGKTLYAARPLNLIQTPPPSYPSSLCSTLSSSSSLSTIIQPRVCWGISALSQWKYELELPQQINGFDPFLIGLRTFSRMKHQSRETCLIGIQIYESSRSDTILMATSHVLCEPSLTWHEDPCELLLELDQLPTPGITYHLQITLNYHTEPNQTDWVHFDCIIPFYAKEQDPFGVQGIKYSIKS